MLMYISGQSFTKSKDAVFEILAAYEHHSTYDFKGSTYLLMSDSLKTRSTRTRENVYLYIKQLKIIMTSTQQPS